MRADAFLAALEAAPVQDLGAVTGDGGLVVLAPHPDDESLGCGGVIAQARAEGRAVRLLVLTDGSGSHPTDDSFTPAMLRDLREDETLAAADALGVPREHVSFLRLPDAHVPSEGAMAIDAARAVVAAAFACRASAVLTTWRHDPHCDHRAAAAIVDLARPDLGEARVLFFSVWGAALPPDTKVGPPPRAWRIDVRDAQPAKQRAIAAHVSQAAGLDGQADTAFQLPPAMVERLSGPFESLFEDPS